ncbi:MAG: hypothetical protein ACTHJ4_01995 [Candidatus Nucleicultricaceae bacterium]
MRFVFISLISLFVSLNLMASRHDIHDDAIIPLKGIYSKRSSLGFVRKRTECGLQLAETDQYFDVYNIAPDGDCAFSGLCIKREAAIQLLIDHLDDPFVFEKVRELFEDNIKNIPSSLKKEAWKEIMEYEKANQSSLAPEQLHTQGSIEIGDEESLSMLKTNTEKKKNFCTQLENMKLFLEHFYGKKRRWLNYMEDTPSAQSTTCFNALAHLLRCNLIIYKKTTEKGVIKRVHKYCPINADETIHLLHVVVGEETDTKENHFDRIVPSQKVEDKTKKTSSIFDLLRVLEKR